MRLDGRAQRFDPAGGYVRRYVPELAALSPGPHPHPVDPGIGYPDPLVEV